LKVGHVIISALGKIDDVIYFIGSVVAALRVRLQQVRLIDKLT
jgi:hypothetical protein